jgi:arylsulfatase A
MNLHTIRQTTLNGVVLAACMLSSGRAADRPPNIIMILADDLGSIDLNCYGATDLETPVLDRLAAGGVRFTQCYAAAPVCSPSRAAFITGLYPQRAGVPGNVPRNDQGGMPTDTKTVAEHFAATGYATGHVGKWHLGHHASKIPIGQGFQESFGHLGGCIDNYSHFFYWSGPNEHDLWRNGQEVFQDGEYFPDMMAKDAIRFIDANSANPFLLYWALNTPHYPLQATDKWRKCYEHLPSPRDKYAAFVSTTDEVIGRVIKHVDDLDLTNDTIIVFQSDHGHSTEVRTFGGGGNSGPYRGAKFSLFEGGIRVPAIISWPGRVPAGETRGQLITGCDWVPTVLAMAGIGGRSLFDGKDISAVIQSSKAESPHEVFHWQSGSRAGKAQWAVRRGPWKLLANPRDTSAGAPAINAERFLVNLHQSITEQNNLADQYPKVVQELEKIHNEWTKHVQP